MRGLLLRPFWPVVQRCAFSSQVPQSGVDKALLSKLRKQTGIPFINCKKALAKFDNDFDEAKKWLLAEAQKEGWARATKLQSRPMSQGLVAVLGDGRQATMLEVNCETDFVAKNEKFIAMVTKLVHDCNNHFENQSDRKITMDKTQLGQILNSDNTSLADIVALNVGNLGENMALRRGAFIRASEDTVLSHYVHPSAPQKSGKQILLGKYGALVEMKPTDPSTPSPVPLPQLGSHLCQHIVGMNPSTIGEYSPPGDTSEDSDEGSREKDSKKADGNEDQEEIEGETTEGVMAGDVSEEALLQQEFLLDTSMTVGELVLMNSVEVVDFARFACGEELQGEGE